MRCEAARRARPVEVSPIRRSYLQPVEPIGKLGQIGYFMMMHYLHPLFMVAAISLWLYVLASGLKRLGAVHFGRKTLFPWKKHVAYGKWAMAGFLVGWCLGLAVTALVWSAPTVTGWHWRVGAAMLALTFVGLFTGLRLDRKRGASGRLRLAHGLCNMLLSLLALSQVLTGLAFLP